MSLIYARKTDGTVTYAEMILMLEKARATSVNT